MSHVYIIAAMKKSMKSAHPSIVLKLPAGRQATNMYRFIKKQLPEARIGFFGIAGDVPGHNQEQTARHSQIVYTAFDFIQAVRSGSEAPVYSRAVL